MTPSGNSVLVVAAWVDGDVDAGGSAIVDVVVEGSEVVPQALVKRPRAAIAPDARNSRVRPVIMTLPRYTRFPDGGGPGASSGSGRLHASWFRTER